MKRTLLLILSLVAASLYATAQEVNDGNMTLGSAGGAEHTWAWKYTTTPPYSLTWQNFNLNPTRLPQVGQLIARPSDGSGKSWWSVGCECVDRSYAIFGNYKEYLGPLGVGYARLQSGWARCEPTRGGYNFQWLDECVDGCLDEGVVPWMCLCYANPIYNNGEYDLNSTIFSDEPTMKAWLKYVEAVVKRYKGKVHMYEIWNEPDGNAYNIDHPETYANLLIRTAEVIRKYDKKAEICAFGMCSRHKMVDDVLKIVSDKGKIDLIDRLSYHLYYSNPDAATGFIHILENIVRKYSDKIVLYQGESGCPSQLEYGHGLKYFEWTEYQQAKWDLRRMLNDFTLGYGSSIFTLVDIQYTDYMLQSFGLVRMDLGKKPRYIRPSYYAVSHIANLITPDFRAVEGFSVEHNSSHDIACVGLEKNGEKVGFMLWFREDMPSATLEKENLSLVVKGMDLEAKDMVYVEPITGKVHDPATCVLRIGHGEHGEVRFSGLPLWDSPIFILKKSAVNYKTLE